MKLLKVGTGNQNQNRKAATQFIAEHIIKTKSADIAKGNILSIDDKTYHVSAYAETPAAFISTPGQMKLKHSIYESGLTTLMFHQQKKGNRAVIYEVEPEKIYVKTNSNSAEWFEIDKASTRRWVCMDNKIQCYEKKHF